MINTIGEYAKWIADEIDYWERYHNHKETMAWLATAFYLSGVTGLVVWIKGHNIPVNQTLLVVILLGLLVTIICFLKMQFGARYKAHITIKGLRRAMAWLLAKNTELSPEEKQIEKECPSSRKYQWPKFIQDQILDAKREEPRTKFPGFKSEVPSCVAVVFVTILALIMVSPPHYTAPGGKAIAAGLLASGFGLLVLGLRLMMLRNSLRRGRVFAGTADRPILEEGTVVAGIGVVTLLVWIFAGGRLADHGAEVLRDTGASVTYIGFLSLIQYAVQSRRGATRCVYVGALATAVIGALLILTYIIWFLLPG